MKQSVDIRGGIELGAASLDGSRLAFADRGGLQAQHGRDVGRLEPLKTLGAPAARQHLRR